MALSGIVITVEMIGKDRVLRGLAAAQNVMKDLRPYFRDVFAPRYFKQVQDAFNMEGQSRDSRGRFAGGRWEKLSPRYKAWKDRWYPGLPILTREGFLRDSLQWTGTHLGPGGVFEAYPTYVIYGTTIPYASAHQKGTARLPARPFMHEPNPEIFGPLLKNWILRNAKKGGLDAAQVDEHEP